MFLNFDEAHLQQSVQEIMHAQTAQDQRCKEQAVAAQTKKALQSIYVALYELNITTDTYTELFAQKERFTFLQGKGKLAEYLSGEVYLRISAEDIDAYLDFFNIDKLHERLMADGSSLSMECRMLTVQGTYEWVQLMLMGLPGYRQEEIYLVFVKDTQAYHRAQAIAQENTSLRQQRENDEKYRMIVEHTGTIVLEYAHGRMSMALGAQQFSFWNNLSNVGQTAFFTPKDVYETDWPLLETLKKEFCDGTRKDAGVKLRLKKANGTYVWCKVVITLHKEEMGGVRCICTVNDVDEAVRAQQKLAYREQYDPLTGYTNYTTFQREAQRLLDERGETKYALWYSDICNFKYVNDLYGYDFGDSVLKHWANAIAAEIGEGETFCRISADTFAVLRKYENKDLVRARYDKVMRALNAYPELQNKRLQINVISGVYLIEGPEDVLSISEMLNRANVAEKSIKYSSMQHVAFYSEEMRNKFSQEQDLQADSIRALARGEFKVYLQGQVDIQNGFIISGAEALVRWQHPERRLVSPGDFIPLFERNGSIAELDLYVFQEVCRFISVRRKAGLELFKISVNVSRITILQPNFVEKYTAIKEEFHVPDNVLELECTESVVVENMKVISTVLGQLHRAGFLLAMDDFGAGYSSLNVLKDLDVDVLKLDKSFFSGGLAESRERIIVASVIAMANALRMKVVAEGVESMDQVMLLRTGNSDVVQGYVFTKPVPMESFAENIAVDKLLAAQHYCEDSTQSITEEMRLTNESQNIFLPDNNSLCGVMHCTYDNYCTILYANKAMYTMLGYTPQALREKHKDHFYPLISSMSLENFDEAADRLEDGGVVGNELAVVRNDGKTAWLHVQMRLTDDDVLEVFAMDVTTQKELQRALEEKQAQLDIVMNHMPGGVLLLQVEDSHIKPLYVNPGLLRMLGFDAAEYFDTHKDVLKNLSAEDAAEMLRQCKACIETGAPMENITLSSKMKNGEKIILQVQGGPVRVQKLAQPAVLVLINEAKADETAKE